MTAIPNRLSIRDADYEHSFGESLSITVDGIEQRMVIAYDIADGSVLRYRDENGHIVIDPDTDDVVEEVVRGNVEVAIRAV